MTAILPPLPRPEVLADLCREVAAREGVQPDLVEKDFFLTRLLWALGDHFGDRLLLKGGTLLSKVDLGFFRMSEDADLVIPEPASRNKGTNMRRINEIRNALTTIEPIVGVQRRFPGGEDSHRGAHRVWHLSYPSEFGPQQLQLEVSLRPTLRAPRQVRLQQLLVDPLIGDYTEASCWALDVDEARAEKVRAACTREAIRDFYDLERLAEAGADLTSPGFLDLVNTKLAEMEAPPVQEHDRAFALEPERRARLERSLKADLRPVIRADAPAFDLEAMLAAFEAKWPRPR